MDKEKLLYDYGVLVDDSSIINTMHLRLIANMGISKNIRSFCNPLEALEQLESLLFIEDTRILVLLDINMPELDGFEFLEEVSAIKKNNALLDIFMVSSSVSEADWNRAATHHMLRGSFIKPLRKGRIEEVLRLRTPIYA